MKPEASSWISVHLPKRLLLPLRTVLALPKASSTGFACGAHLVRRSGSGSGVGAKAEGSG